ncbi:MAG TPA: SRPBCC family protein [Polyangiales bacterium]|nr:SRPBCC family protein [Polyangiales bacterium]
MQSNRSLLPTFALLACSLWVTSPVAAAPDAKSNAKEQRLDTLDDKERALLQPLMERGPISLVEFAQGDVLPAILVAGYVDAPADQVASVISHPADYPKFMRTLDSVQMLSESPTQNAYKWTWQTAGVLFLEGENRMTILAPPRGKPDQGYRISIKSERGQLGEGRLMWRVLPVGKTRSFVSLGLRIDMRDANYVMQKLDAAARSINRSVNIALAHVMLLGTKREAERRAGSTVALPATVPFDAPKVDLEKLKGILDRADLLTMELTPSGLGKLSVIGRGGATPEELNRVMTDPETFGKSLVQGSYTRVTKTEGKTKTFEWGVNLPLVGTKGEMTMTSDPQLVSIDATDGALKGGRWRFITPRLASGEGVVIGYSQFDVTKSSWLVEKIAGIDPAMGHGLAAATQVMMLRALRKRVQQEREAAAIAPQPAPPGTVPAAR